MNHNIGLAADVVVFTVGKGRQDTTRKMPNAKLQVLLIRRGRPPFQGDWALPGGFMEQGESLRETAYRELYEETGLVPNHLEQLYTWSDVDRDPRGRVISTSHLAVLNAQHSRPRAGDDASEARWFDLSYSLERSETSEDNGHPEYIWDVRLHLTSGTVILSALVRGRRTFQSNRDQIHWQIIENHGLAFDHAKVLGQGLEVFRHKIRNTDLLFNLMPEFFSLAQLHQVYEAALGTTMNRGRFRTLVSGKLRKTASSAAQGGSRPAQLYMYDSQWLRDFPAEDLELL